MSNSKQVLRVGVRPREGWIAALVVAGVVFGAVPANAQRLDISLSLSMIPFASADPDTTPLVAAPMITVTYRVRNNAAGNWQMTLLASGDLSSGSATIPVSAITWTATPAPRFQSGTMSATVAQTLASGSGNVEPARTGHVQFYYANSWSHNVGVYSSVFTFTLAAP